MRYEPNLSLLFAELPLLERPRAAAAAGFDAAELWWPFHAADPGQRALDDLARAFEAAGLQLACLNLFGGDLSSGERGALAVLTYRDEFQANLSCAMALAGRLGCGTLNALYGNLVDGTTAEAAAELALTNLAYAADAATGIGATVVVEALNPVDHPAYGLPTVGDVMTFLDRARDRGIEASCSFDMYHAATAGEQLDELIDRHAHRFGHVQIADVPGRSEPGTGSLDVIANLDRLRRCGYDGWVGLEYVPATDTVSSLRRTMSWLSGESMVRPGA